MTNTAVFPEDTLRAAIRVQYEGVTDEVVPVADLARPLTAGFVVLSFGLTATQLVRGAMLGTPATPLLIGAWIAVAVAVALVIRSALRSTSAKPFIAGLTVGLAAGAIALDVLSRVPGQTPAVLTAGAATGTAFALLAAAGWPRLAVWSGVVLVAGDIAITLGTQPFGPLMLAGQLLDAFAIVAPAFFWAVLMTAFARVASTRIERARAAFVAREGGFTLGMRASQDLVELDLESESLLRSVALGEEPLPLPQHRAEEAARLASQLRQHLLAARQDSWLAHAIAESPSLHARVALDDPASISAGFEPKARESLVRALWLLVDDSERQHVTVQLSPARRSFDGNWVTATLLLERPVAREPAVLEALSELGQTRLNGRNVTIQVRLGLSNGFST